MYPSQIYTQWAKLAELPQTAFEQDREAMQILKRITTVFYS